MGNFFGMLILGIMFVQLFVILGIVIVGPILLIMKIIERKTEKKEENDKDYKEY